MHACMHVMGLHARVSVRDWGCMHLWRQACMHFCLHAFMGACSHVCMHAHACMSGCMQMHACTSACTQVTRADFSVKKISARSSLSPADSGASRTQEAARMRQRKKILAARQEQARYNTCMHACVHACRWQGGLGGQRDSSRGGEEAETAAACSRCGRPLHACSSLCLHAAPLCVHADC